MDLDHVVLWVEDHGRGVEFYERVVGLKLKVRLASAGIACSAPITQSTGARGLSREAFYFSDPDGNVVEARVYD